MTETQIKLKYIFYPFLVVEAFSALAYSIANYYLFLQHGWLQLDERVTNMAIPFAVSIIPVLIWVRPNIRLLNLAQARRGNPFFGYMMIATLAIAVVTLTLQNYLILALGKLTPLEQISEISSRPATRFYTVKQHYTHPHDFYISYSSAVSGKHNNYLNFYAYIVCPLYNNPGDTIKNSSVKPAAWLGTKYNRQISNNANWDYKAQAQRNFQRQIRGLFNPFDLNNFVYLSTVPRGYDKRRYANAIKLYSDTPVPNPLILQAHKDSFSNHTGNFLWWLVLAFVIGNGVFLMLILDKPVNKQNVSGLRLGDTGDFNNWKSDNTFDR